MSHIDEISYYIEKNLETQLTIERPALSDERKAFLEEAIKNYSTSRVLIAGIGTGEIVKLFAEKCELVVVVEPCLNCISRFVGENKELVKKGALKIINGDLAQLPVDYYAVSMIVCVDYLDFQNTAMVLDEFKRVIDFEGIFVFCGTVLNGDDVEGVYDELYHKIMPMHNDFYLPSDLALVLSLKKFNPVKELSASSTVDIEGFADFGKSHGERFAFSLDKDYTKYIEDNKEDFKKFYGLEGRSVREPYFMGLYRSAKPEKENYEAEVKEYLKKAGRKVDEESSSGVE